MPRVPSRATAATSTRTSARARHPPNEAARLPLSDAVARYSDAATRALDDPQLPPASRQVMADYFEQLSGSPTIPSN